jgi:glycosyltransferase involved in cell wall biosynthesis
VRQTPVLLLAYNRADKLRGLIDALRVSSPQLVMVVVDGPKPGDPADEAKVQSVRNAVAAIDWTPNVLRRFRPTNLGLRSSVADAVAWATREYGQVIVIEDDVLPGAHFVEYAERMLDEYRDDERVMHISGYNVVERADLGSPDAQNRFTRYPESFAWATWDRAWRYYDDDLTWPRSTGLRELRRVTGSRSAAVRWRFNFMDAQAGRISTWAYRWIASIWSHGGVALNPNHNLVTYVGQEDGTHTLTKPSWKELPLYDGPLADLLVADAVLDERADRWVSRTVFGGTPFGAARGVLVSVALELRKRRRARRAARR